MSEVWKPQGLYREERNRVRVLAGGQAWPMTKVEYVKLGGRPPFQKLPTREQYRRHANTSETPEA